MFYFKIPLTLYFAVYFMYSLLHLNLCVDSLMLAHMKKGLALPLPIAPDRHSTWSQAIQWLLPSSGFLVPLRSVPDSFWIYTYMANACRLYIHSLNWISLLCVLFLFFIFFIIKDWCKELVRLMILRTGAKNYFIFCTNENKAFSPSSSEAIQNLVPRKLLALDFVLTK